MKFPDLHKVDKWVEKIISYPGIDDKALILRKDYWLASFACGFVIICLTLTFWIIHPQLKILITYGLFLIIIFLEFIIASIVIRRNLEWLMFVNQSLMTIGTFLCILKLGGIPYSGGLIFVGFFVVLFSLDFQKISHSIWLFIIYVITVILAGALNRYLSVPPEMTASVNITLFVINLLWISSFAFLFVMNFISQRVKIEQREAKRLKELDEAKTRFYTNITHEFRTPLTIILGMADLIRNQPEEWLDEGVIKIENNGKILLHQVNQMLDLSKLEANAMPVNMIQADIILYIRYLVELFQSLAGSKNITLQYLPKTDHFMMDYDPDKLMQVISNFVSNALKYTQSGGLVEISSALTNNREPELEIRIKDNGPGIPKDQLPCIFDRFYRVDHSNAQSIEGSGLGLALTRELVKLLNGTITAKSEYGEGTEFVITLPVTNNAPFNEAGELTETDERISTFMVFHDKKSTATTVKEVVQKDKPLLLIVEDSNDVVRYLLTFLEPEFNVHTAVNGKEGVEKALELIPDIILSDIMMPEMDGIALLDKVKNDIRTSHIPVVILTAKADITSRLEGIERGADAYIAKPFNKEELVMRLNKLIELRKKLQERYSSIGHFAVTQDKEYRLEDSFMQKIREIMFANLSDEMFDIHRLCLAVAMSRAQLYRKFKSITDRTLSEYLRSLRLLKARELLRTSDINVSEAAYKTGFKNLSHFSRVFTEEFGVNPSEVHK